MDNFCDKIHQISGTRLPKNSHIVVKCLMFQILFMQTEHSPGIHCFGDYING